MDEDYRKSLVEGELIGARFVLTAPRVAPMGVAGSQLGRAAGSSLEFMDHREYQPGDDLRRIDWSAYARTDRLIVKLYRQEVSPHVDLLMDGSRSMTVTPAKSRAVLSLAAMFAGAAGNGGFTHRAWLVSAGCEAVANGAERPGLWDRIDFDHRGSLMDSLARTPPRWRPRGVRILISDLLFPADPLVVLSQISHGSAACVVVQCLAAADAEPPAHGNVRLVDSESQVMREVFVDAAAQATYRANFTRHQQNWHLACRQTGATFVCLVAEKVLQDWSLEPLVAAQVLSVN